MCGVGVWDGAHLVLCSWELWSKELTELGVWESGSEGALEWRREGVRGVGQKSFETFS